MQLYSRFEKIITILREALLVWSGYYRSGVLEGIGRRLAEKTKAFTNAREHNLQFPGQINIFGNEERKVYMHILWFFFYNNGKTKWLSD